MSGERALARKGILLVGGTGSRLHPVTLGISKHLLPVYDKPMAYYPLSVLMLAGIKEVLVVTTPEDALNYRRLFGDGTHLGMNLHYALQPHPGGIAEVFEIAAAFIGGSPVCLVLGDNIFYGQGFTPLLQSVSAREEGATLFAYPVKDPHRFGIVSLDENGLVGELEEKPDHFVSSLAVTGLYFFDGNVVEISAGIKPSSRGEKEIIDVLKAYRDRDVLAAEVLGRGFVWLDAGTPETLLEAGVLVQAVEQRQGLKIACLEEIAWRAGWVTEDQVMSRADELEGTAYSEYLINLLHPEG